MITRLWRGWTTPDNAAAYENLLRSEIFPHIESRGINGYIDVRLLRRDLDDEVEFLTILRFCSFDAVRSFAGDDYEVAVVPPAAQELLCRFDERSAHYDSIIEPPA